MREAPSVPPGGDVYLSAFWDLSTCRSVVAGAGGVAIGPIPWRDVAAYADRLGLAPDVAAQFHEIMRVLDDEYLKAKRTELEAQVKPAPSTSPQPRRRM